MNGILRNAVKAVGERVTGVGPGPFRAAFVATVAGAATGVLTYRALRSDSLGDVLNTGEDS